MGFIIMKIFIILGFILIVLSLGTALSYMIRGQGNSKKMLTSLKIRVGVSVFLILSIILAYYLGWIHSTGIKTPIL